MNQETQQSGGNTRAITPIRSLAELGEEGNYRSCGEGNSDPSAAVLRSIPVGTRNTGTATGRVIAHPTWARGSTCEGASSTKRRTSSTEARFAFAVLTTERKAA